VVPEAPQVRGFPRQEQGHMQGARGAAPLHQGAAPAVEFCSARAGDRRDDVPRCVQGDVDPPPPGGRRRLLQRQWAHGAPSGSDPLPCKIRFRISNQDQRGYQVAGGGVRGGVCIHGEGLSMSSWTPLRSSLHLEHGPDARPFFVSPLENSLQVWDQDCARAACGSLRPTRGERRAR